MHTDHEPTYLLKLLSHLSNRIHEIGDESRVLRENYKRGLRGRSSWKEMSERDDRFGAAIMR